MSGGLSRAHRKGSGHTKISNFITPGLKRKLGDHNTIKRKEFNIDIFFCILSDWEYCSDLLCEMKSVSVYFAQASVTAPDISGIEERKKSVGISFKEDALHI